MKTKMIKHQEDPGDMTEGELIKWLREIAS